MADADPDRELSDLPLWAQNATELSQKQLVKALRELAHRAWVSTDDRALVGNVLFALARGVELGELKPLNRVLSDSEAYLQKAGLLDRKLTNPGQRYEQALSVTQSVLDDGQRNSQALANSIYLTLGSAAAVIQPGATLSAQRLMEALDELQPKVKAGHGKSWDADAVVAAGLTAAGVSPATLDKLNEARRGRQKTKTP
ncbi:MAG: hypothetical protein ABI548_02745 [Polyangiaceae bacterium]